VFEHILVAEELLRRYLVLGETVHHTNGIRDDKRPENLELWDVSTALRYRGERRNNLGAVDLRPLRGCRCTSNGAHGLP